MRVLLNLVTLSLLVVGGREALAAGGGGRAGAGCCGGRTSVLQERTTLTPQRQQISGTKVRTKVMFCGGGASCAGTTVWRLAGETEAQHGAKVATLLGTHQAEAKALLAHPTDSRGIRTIDVEKHAITRTLDHHDLTAVQSEVPGIAHAPAP